MQRLCNLLTQRIPSLVQDIFIACAVMASGVWLSGYVLQRQQASPRLYSP